MALPTGRTGRGAVAALALATTLAVLGCRATSAEQVAASVRDAVATREAPAYAVRETWSEIQDIYRRREFTPIWLGPDGRPTVRTTEFVDAVCRADRRGLRRGDYNLAGLHGALERAYAGGRANAAELAEVELRLTSLFAQYGHHLVAGRVESPKDDPVIDSLLRTALAAGTWQETLALLEPSQVEYRQLLDALADYREVAARGGWPTVPGTTPIRPGDRGSRVEALRARLAASGDLGGRPPRDPAVYDRSLSEAVALFQERHGLEPDGVADEATLAVLAVPVETRIRQLELNLERHRRLPRAPGDRYLLINVPDLRLFAFEGGRQRLSMRVQVGREYAPLLPVFADSIDRMVFQPVWSVPPEVVRTELVTRVRADSDFLAEHAIVATDDAGRPLAARALDSAVRAARPLQVRQMPHPSNPLGRVAWWLAGQDDLYLHDGPRAEGFAPESAATPGGIRVEDPVQLAEFTLAGAPGWDARAIREALTAGDSTAVDRTVELPAPLPTFVVYLTAFVRDGRLHFRGDPFGLDERALERIGRASPPGMICSRLQRLLRPGEDAPRPTAGAF